MVVLVMRWQMRCGWLGAELVNVVSIVIPMRVERWLGEPPHACGGHQNGTMQSHGEQVISDVGVELAFIE